MRRSRLVLPQPLGPSRAVWLPVGSVRDAPRSSVRSPAVRDSSRSSTAVRLTTGVAAPSFMAMAGSSRGLSGRSRCSSRDSMARRLWLSFAWVAPPARLWSRASLLPMREGSLPRWDTVSAWRCIMFFSRFSSSSACRYRLF